jgi:hypothetical protein
MNLSEARILAELYIEKYLSNQDGGRWHFAWNNHKRTYGMCIYGKKQIVLSKFLTPHCSEAEVEDTILHEIAHALTPGSGHGRLWKIMARKLGANPYSTRALDDDQKEAVSEHYKWVMIYMGEPEKIIKGYYRKPNATTFAKIGRMWLRNRMRETKGKLTIVPASEYKKLKARKAVKESKYTW